jgi:hypothetical protein
VDFVYPTMALWCSFAVLAGASQDHFDEASLMQFSLDADGVFEEALLMEGGKANVTAAPSSQVRIANARADCYQKLVFDGHSKPITQADLDACATLIPPSHSCAYDKGWTYILDYHDNRELDDIPDDRNEIQAGFRKESAFFIGNAALENMAITKAEVCIVAEAQSCATSCIDMIALQQYIASDVGCDVTSGLSTPVKKALGVFSGQCASYDAKWFNPPAADLKTFPAPYSDIGWQCGTASERGFSAWSPQGSNWHAIGNGLTLSVNSAPGMFGVGPHKREFGWYWPTATNCAGQSGLDINILQIRVKV